MFDKVISYAEQSDPVKEAYRVLRTNIQFCDFDKRIKTIAITSCNPGEGKTTTSLNLSIIMAKTGMKVLLVDADLRKSMFLKSLGPKENLGLSNIIAGYNTLDELVVEGEIENFYYLPSGPKPPNPSELLNSEGFKDFLRQAKCKFDMVIIDTPPLGAVIDCAVISTEVDGTIIVIEANHTERFQALRLKEQLEKVGAIILGVILNKIDKRQYKNYYRYYNYYGRETKNTRLFNKI